MHIQDLLEYQPGRKRESHAKKKRDWDWAESNTNQIQFESLDKFLLKHAKKTQRYIEATFERVKNNNYLYNSLKSNNKK